MVTEYKPEELAKRVFWLAMAGIAAQIVIILLIIH
jgi:hypothetical protein